MADMGRSVSTSSCLTRWRRTPAMTWWMVRPTTSLKLLWRELFETATCLRTSLTPMPSQACARMNRIASATWGSTMAVTSVD